MWIFWVLGIGLAAFGLYYIYLTVWVFMEYLSRKRSRRLSSSYSPPVQTQWEDIPRDPW